MKRVKQSSNDKFDYGQIAKTVGEYDEINAEISHQNGLYSELIENDKLTIEPFWCATIDYLHEQQSESITKRDSVSGLEFFDDLYSKEKSVRDELGRLAAEVAALEQEQADEIDKIIEQEKMIVDKLPELKDKLDLIAQQLINQQIEKSTMAAKAKISVLEEEYQEISSLYETAGEAWPIPKVARVNGSIEKENSEEGCAEIDIFPAPEKPRLSNTEIAGRVKKNYPDDVLKDASAFVALFLVEEPGYIYSYQDLAEVLYGQNDRTHASRATALISAHRLNKNSIIADIMAEKGLVVQQGLRRKYDLESKKSYGAYTTVIRAVRPETLDQEEIIIRHYADESWIIDEWKTITSASPSENEQIKSEPKMPAENTAHETKEEINVDNEDEIVELTPEVTIDLREKKPNPVAREKKRPQWQIRFEKEVQEAIDIFELKGLLETDYPVGKALVNIKLESAIMGTDEMLKRALANKIITRTEAKGELPIDISKWICMYLQNTHGDIFGNRTNRRKAIQIVNDMLNRQFQSKKNKR